MVWDARLSKVLALAFRKDTVEHLEVHMVAEEDMVVLSPTTRNRWPSVNKIILNHITLGKKPGMRALEVETARAGLAFETLEAMVVE